MTNGRVSCLSSSTGVAVFVTSGSTALAVKDAAFSTFTAFCRIVEVFSCFLLDRNVFHALGNGGGAMAYNDHFIVLQLSLLRP